jgi:hypothetical protein
MTQANLLAFDQIRQLEEAEMATAMFRGMMG